MDEKQIHDVLWEAAQELYPDWGSARQAMPDTQDEAIELLEKAIKSIENGLTSGEYESDSHIDEMLRGMEETLDHVYTDDSYFYN